MRNMENGGNRSACARAASSHFSRERGGHIISATPTPLLAFEINDQKILSCNELSLSEPNVEMPCDDKRPLSDNFLSAALPCSMETRVSILVSLTIADCWVEPTAKVQE